MTTLISNAWNRDNRTEKIREILPVFNLFGKVELVYFKEKSTILSYYLWKGNPQPVNEDDDWNHVKITLNGKLIIEFIELLPHFFSSKPVFEGHFFDEHFTESEIQQILDAFKNIEIITYKEYLSRKRKFILYFSIVIYALFAFHVLILGNYGLSILLLCCILILLWFLFRR